MGVPELLDFHLVIFPYADGLGHVTQGGGRCMWGACWPAKQSRALIFSDITGLLPRAGGDSQLPIRFFLLWLKTEAATEEMEQLSGEI